MKIASAPRKMICQRATASSCIRFSASPHTLEPDRVHGPACQDDARVSSPRVIRRAVSVPTDLQFHDNIETHDNLFAFR